MSTDEHGRFELPDQMTDAVWRESSFCSASTCVEVAFKGDTVRVRSSVTPDRSVEFASAEWAAFVAGVKAGEFDLLHEDDPIDTDLWQKKAEHAKRMYHQTLDRAEAAEQQLADAREALGTSTRLDMFTTARVAAALGVEQPPEPAAECVHGWPVGCCRLGAACATTPVGSPSLGEPAKTVLQEFEDSIPSYAYNGGECCASGCCDLCQPHRFSRPS